MTHLVDGLPLAEWPAWLRAFAAVWLFVVGSCFGSFLNVVAYRWPRRMSLSRPGSHCPHCSRRITPSDNVPIVAWLWLGGRCRKCGEAISPRYPLVELLAAVAFLLIGWGELLTPRGGWLLAATHGHEGRAALTLAGHLTLVVTMLAAALLVLERANWRGTLFLPAAIVAGAVVAAGLPLAPKLTSALAARQPGAVVLTAAQGLAIGMTLAVVWRFTERRLTLPASARYTVACWLLIGVFLGPLATAIVALVSSVGELATAVARRAGLAIDRLSTSGWLLAAVVVSLGGWTYLCDTPYMALERPGRWIAAGMAVAGIAMAATGYLARAAQAR
ncbi:MAG: prepilin peptidase [Pirellulales bacterium]